MAPSQPRACAAIPDQLIDDRGRSATAVSPERAAWRLTDRGIALVLVVAAMVAVAALAVLVPTALRVTGDNYQPIGTSQLTRS